MRAQDVKCVWLHRPMQMHAPKCMQTLTNTQTHICTYVSAIEIKTSLWDCPALKKTKALESRICSGLSMLAPAFSMCHSPLNATIGSKEATGRSEPSVTQCTRLVFELSVLALLMRICASCSRTMIEARRRNRQQFVHEVGMYNPHMLSKSFVTWIMVEGQATHDRDRRKGNLTKLCPGSQSRTINRLPISCART